MTDDDPTPGRDALLAALIDLERHIGQHGWDQPPRLFALVPTDDLIAAEPELAETQGLVGTAQGGEPGALTAIEQEHFQPTTDLVADLTSITWPPAVYGCAVSFERTFLPSGSEGDIPDDPEEAAAYVAEHDKREDIRVVVGADRGDNSQGVARLVSQPDELLGAEDLVPGLAEVLAHTLQGENGPPVLDEEKLT